MRRPLKPFVTEYKGPRRASPSLAEPAPHETERPAPKLSEARNLADARPDSEDSYEAAMRAADALFAAPAARKSEARSASPDDSMTPHDGFAECAAPERNGGRILRVIDEAPPPQYAALEAEFAPKRRGRKPGSKNKPKIPALTSGLEPQTVQHQGFAPQPMEPARPTYAAVPRQVPAQRAPVSTSGQVVALSAAAPESRSGDKRYPWVRDRLKPGEDWKRRRLPRVCW